MNNSTFISFIPDGRENARSMKELALILGIDVRTVRTHILAAHLSGSPICSTCKGNQHGYFMPCNVAEARLYLQEQHSRIRTSKAAMRAVEDYILKGGVNND